jgi:hypothetical protein
MISDMDWINLDQDRDQWRNLQVQYNFGKFLSAQLAASREGLIFMELVKLIYRGKFKVLSHALVHRTNFKNPTRPNEPPLH